MIDVTELGYNYVRILPNGSFLAVLPMLFGNGRLILSDDPYVVKDAWCYESVEKALLAMGQWNPETESEPSGWIRHLASGRRRPNGDESREYINL